MSTSAHAGYGAAGGAVAVLPVLVELAALAVAYGRGLRGLAPGRDRALARGAARHGTARTLAFVAGLLAVAAALLPPLDTAADHRFAAHMAQHMVLIVVAAPLLAAGAPGLPLLLALPPRWRLVLARARHVLATERPLAVLGLPVTAWLLHVAALWAWHLPAAYDAALRSDAVHVLEHASFLGTAWLFWWHVATPHRRRLSGPVAVLYVFVTALPSAALGAVLTFARTPLYPEQAAAAAAAGVPALRDQQLAGLVMWVPADVVYLAITVALFLPWLGALGPAAAGTREPVLLAPGEGRR